MINVPGKKRNMKKIAESSRVYNAKFYDRLYPFVRKGHKAEIQAAADAAGETLNEYIVNAIDARMAREASAMPRISSDLHENCPAAKEDIQKCNKGGD